MIADDHDVVRKGLRHMLEDRPRWSVVAEAAEGQDAITKALASKPDVAILDYSMPLINGIEATLQIRQRVPTVEALIFTMHDNDSLLRQSVQAGARGYVLKSDAGQHLVCAIRSLAAHKPYFTSKASETLLQAFRTETRQLDHTLTSRERDVVELVTEGHSNKQVAALLNISIKTVETHRSSAMRKLGLTTLAALVRYALRNDWIQA